MKNLLIVLPGEGPRGVALPEGITRISPDLIRALLGCDAVERCDALFGGEPFHLYADATAAASERPENEHATRMRRAAILRRNPKARDRAAVRGPALLVQP